MIECSAAIFTDEAPKGRGPFPQALRAGPFVFLSGQGPLDPHTNALVAGGFEEQVERTFDNIAAILTAADLTLGSIVKITVYLSDLARIPEFNALYAARLGRHRPARTLVQAGLRGIDVEMDVIAFDLRNPELRP